MQEAGFNGYLRHVDGLRGVSVLLVVLYHAWPDSLPGGFIGVDVFFVISGFLITRLLLAEQAAGTFRYGDFLMRRIRRLWPSFALVMGVTLLLGWVVLDTRELADLGRTALAAIGFSSNWYFALTTDYFNEGLARNLLLHSWSLAVEEQFYLLYPLLLIWLLRFERGVLIGLCALWAISFGGVLFLGQSSEAFFATHLRVWELASGALLWCAIAGGKRPGIAHTHGRWLARLGLFMIVLTAALMPKQIWWPSALALVPVAGAMLCIVFPLRGLEARWLVGTGLISYALYLWHWPILKGVEILLSGSPDGVLAAAIFVSIGLAYLAWRYVEEPIRRRRAFGETKRLIGLAGGVCLLMAGIGWQYHAQDGFPGRFSQDIAVIEATRSDTRKVSLDCKSGLKPLADLFGFPVEPETGVPSDRRITICVSKDYDENKPSILYVGDSHLGALRGEISARAKIADTQIIVATLAACPPVFGVSWEWQGVDRAERCQRLQKLVLNIVQTGQIEKLVLVGHWDIYAGQAPKQHPEFDTHFENLVEAVFGKAQLHVLLDVPTHDLEVVPTLIRGVKFPWLPAPKWLTRARHEAVRAPYVELMNSLEKQGKLTLYDPVPAMCPVDVCLVQNEAGIFYTDGSHVTQIGAAFVLDAVPDLPQ